MNEGNQLSPKSNNISSNYISPYSALYNSQQTTAPINHNQYNSQYQHQYSHPPQNNVNHSSYYNPQPAYVPPPQPYITQPNHIPHIPAQHLNQNPYQTHSIPLDTTNPQITSQENIQQFIPNSNDTTQNNLNASSLSGFQQNTFHQNPIQPQIPSNVYNQQNYIPNQNQAIIQPPYQQPYYTNYPPQQTFNKPSISALPSHTMNRYVSSYTSISRQNKSILPKEHSQRIAMLGFLHTFGNIAFILKFFMRQATETNQKSYWFLFGFLGFNFLMGELTHREYRRSFLIYFKGKDEDQVKHELKEMEKKIVRVI